MTKLRGSMLIAGLLSLWGCAEDARVAPLQARVAALEKQLEDLKFQVSLQSDMQRWDHIAYLTPGSQGYAAVKTDLGYLTVNVANIAPYANGSKVSLTFGNLTSATIDGLKAKIEWGSVDERGVPKNAEAKSREVTVTESLNPGAWNKADFVLEGVPPAALGFVRLRDIGHQGIRLRGTAR